MSDLGFSAITDTSEVVELREELRTLVRRVDRLADRVRELELKERVVTPTPTVASREEHFPFASPGSYTSPVVPPLPTYTGGSASGAGASTEQSLSEVQIICGEIGRFLHRALAGSHRGNSGRNKLRAGSTVYLVVRDWSGAVTTEPCRVIHRFSEVRNLCSRNGQWGDSIFVGLPSLREVEWVCAAAEFGVPR